MIIIYELYVSFDVWQFFDESLKIFKTYTRRTIQNTLERIRIWAEKQTVNIIFRQWILSINIFDK